MNQMPATTGIDKENAVYSVTQLSRKIKYVLAENPQFKDLLLEGEISNFRRPDSGHIYFDLKDENTVIACVYFKYLQDGGSKDLGNGTQIVARGSLISFESRSQYQLKITKITKIGEGKHSLETKRLREKLEDEGLFDDDRKMKVPAKPKNIGIITSKNSEAVQDILNVISSRNPMMKPTMAYATIQGEGAPSSIIKALKDLNEDPDVDVIVLARGGGTSEDFMAFNDEGLVRAVASSKKPVITGIGHAVDLCLADMAADVKATTPSTAAEAAVPNYQKSALQKYKVVIAALIALLVLLILVFLIIVGLISI